MHPTRIRDKQMKQISKKLCVALLVMGIVLCLNACSNANAQPGSVNVPSERWEYKLLTGEDYGYRRGNIESALNRLGKEGWELVSYENSQNSGNSSPSFVFKRRMP